MNLTDKIIEKIKSLPEQKHSFFRKSLEEERRDWQRFSLDSAMKGMKTEEELYSLKDLKEVFNDS